MKMIIVDSLRYLVERSKIRIYAFVIMPNHIHLIWELIEHNGKEYPSASFMKFTAHRFLEQLLCAKTDLHKYYVGNEIRKYQFWQDKPKAFELFSRHIVEQKMDYIHSNPIQPHWNLVDDPLDYRFSSLLFYDKGCDEFNFLNHYMDRF